MVDFAALADKAATKIAEFGREVTFVRLSRTVTDPTKPHRAVADPTLTPDEEVTGSAVFVGTVGASGPYLGLETVSEELLKRSEQIAIVALGSTSTVNLRTFEQIVDGSTRWQITGVQELKPGAQSLLFFVGVKR